MDKCNHCKKKRYILLECKCNKIYCIKHLHDHSCKYDYKKEQKEKIKTENPKIVNEKIQKL